MPLPEVDVPGAQQQRAQVPPVQRLRTRCGDAAHCRQRRQQVAVPRHRFDQRARLHLPRPPHEARHPAAALVDAALLLPHAAVVAVGVRPVVREKDDDRLLRDARFIKPRQHPPHVLVDVGDHRVGGLRLHVEARDVREAVEVLVRHLGRPVRRLVRHVAQERPARGVPVPHEADRPVRQHVRQVAVRLQRAAAPAAAVLPDRRVEVVVPMPRAEADEQVEALPHRVHRIRRPVVPLAEGGGRVAGVLEQLGDRHLVGPHVLHAAGDAVDVRPQVHPPGQQRRPRRRADRRDVEPLQPRPVLRDRVQVRRLEVLVAVDREVAPALVVGHDEQHVRRGGEGGEEEGEHAR